MKFLESDIIKFKILEILSKENTEITLNSLRNKMKGINYHSLIKNCYYLKIVGSISIEEKQVENRKFNFVKITEEGFKKLKLYKNETSN